MAWFNSKAAKVTPVGNGLRAVPPGLERHGGRSLQERRPRVLPCFEPCRLYARDSTNSRTSIGHSFQVILSPVTLNVDTTGPNRFASDTFPFPSLPTPFPSALTERERFANLYAVMNEKCVNLCSQFCVEVPGAISNFRATSWRHNPCDIEAKSPVDRTSVLGNARSAWNNWKAGRCSRAICSRAWSRRPGSATIPPAVNRSMRRPRQSRPALRRLPRVRRPQVASAAN